MPHDQLWKILLWQFPAEFLTLFFPDEASRLDVSTARAIDKEVFTDLPEGARREPDVLLEFDARDGGTEVVLVHIEVQVERDAAVPYRMWQYYCLLRLRLDKPVFPIVLYLSPGAGGLVEEGYEERVLGRQVLSFRYAAVDLADLRAADYDASENVLAPALSALMRAPGVDRAMRKLRALERLLSAHMDEARRSLLRYVVDKYLAMSDDDDRRFEALLRARGMEDAMGVVTRWEDYLVQRGVEQGIERGIEQGIEQGVVQGARQTLLGQLRAKFGEVPAEQVVRLEAIGDATVLEVLAERILSAQTLGDMRLDDLPAPD